jgi:hypothetical protein
MNKVRGFHSICSALGVKDMEDTIKASNFGPHANVVRILASSAASLDGL